MVCLIKVTIIIIIIVIIIMTVFMFLQTVGGIPPESTQ
jgi:hypothetical protein